MLDKNGNWVTSAEAERLTELDRKRHATMLDAALRKPRGLLVTFHLDTDQVVVSSAGGFGFVDAANGLTVDAAELTIMVEAIADRGVAPTLVPALRAACASLQAREYATGVAQVGLDAPVTADVV